MKLKNHFCKNFSDTDYAQHPLHVLSAQLVMHRKADDLLGDAVGDRKVFLRSGFQTSVRRELADEGIEVSAAVDVPRLQFVVQFIPGHAVLLRVHEDREVRVIVPYARHILEVRDAGDVPKALAVGDGDPVPGLDGLVHMLKIYQSYRGAHLVHLPVDAGGNDCGLTGKAEVLEVVYALLSLCIMHYKCSALYRVVYLSRMKAERGHIARVQETLAVHLHAESVGCIVDDPEAVLVRYVLYPSGVARLAVAVHGHDGRGPRGYRRLDAVRIDAAVRRVDVHEHRLDAVPPQRVGRRDEAERSGDDLARDAQGLQGCYQRQGAVGEKADVGNLEVLAQSCLKFFMIVSVVGDPFAGPDVPQVRVELVQVRKERGRHGYLSVVHRFISCFF